ncbi:MAG: hypothetical protein U1E96_05830 [Azonexus sp.]
MTDSFEGNLLAEIPKNQREVYRVFERTYKATRRSIFRTWYDNLTTGELRPGKGVSIKAECLPQILDALHKTDRERRMNHGQVKEKINCRNRPLKTAAFGLLAVCAGVCGAISTRAKAAGGRCP